jgi:hypothetical protein
MTVGLSFQESLRLICKVTHACISFGQLGFHRCAQGTVQRQGPSYASKTFPRAMPRGYKNRHGRMAIAIASGFELVLGETTLEREELRYIFGDCFLVCEDFALARRSREMFLHGHARLYSHDL